VAASLAAFIGMTGANGSALSSASGEVSRVARIMRPLGVQVGISIALS
jgi:hypothetical protein